MLRNLLGFPISLSLLSMPSSPLHGAKPPFPSCLQLNHFLELPGLLPLANYLFQEPMTFYPFPLAFLL